MKQWVSALVLVACTGLTACQTVPQQPPAAMDNPPAARQKSTTETRPGRPETDKVVDQLQPMLERLSGQQLKQQEQLLNVSGQYAQLSTTLDKAVMLLKKQSQMIAMQAQAESASSGQGSAPADFEPMLDQVIALLNDQSGGSATPAGRYGVSSAYTAKGQWVLIRFDRRSGETWLADQGRWQSLQDGGQALPAGDYRVVVLRADQDVKGYVASRIEQRTGTTWWLRQTRWQKFSAQ